MENHNHTLIPPPSVILNTDQMGSNSRKKHETHNKASWDERFIKERQRRDQMSENFNVLHSIVPTLSNAHKPSKEKIIGDTINYVKYLEEEIERLEDIKKFQLNEPNHVLAKCTYQSSSVKFTASIGALFLEIQLPSRRGSVAKIACVLEKHRADVLEARVCVNEQRLLTFTATIMLGKDGGTTIEKIREEILTL